MNERRQRSWFASSIFAVLFVLQLSGSLSAVAQESTPPLQPEAASNLGPQFVIRPADGADGDFFELELAAGRSTELKVIVGNADDEPLSLLTYVADVVPATNGGFALAREDVAPVGVATWIDYATDAVTLQPGEGIEREFKVTIPKDVMPGQYVAGLALQTAEPLEVEGTTLFTQTIRKIVQVFITVPGPVQPQFGFGEAVVSSETGVINITVPVDNSGNVLVRPRGTFALSDADGQQVYDVPIKMGSVYAGMSVPLVVTLTTPLAEGQYSVSLQLADEATGATGSMTDQPITINSEQQAPDRFELAGDIGLQPDPADPVFADVAVDVTNNGKAVDSSEVVLDVMKDGALVESFTLASSLALAQGTTEVSTRYIPPTGFDSGEWSFVIRLNVVDPSSKAATTVATLEDIPPVTIGK
jgi:hypothetical protein